MVQHECAQLGWPECDAQLPTPCRVASSRGCLEEISCPWSVSIGVGLKPCKCCLQIDLPRKQSIEVLVHATSGSPASPKPLCSATIAEVLQERVFSLQIAQSPCSGSCFTPCDLAGCAWCTRLYIAQLPTCSAHSGHIKELYCRQGSELSTLLLLILHVWGAPLLLIPSKLRLSDTFG